MAVVAGVRNLSQATSGRGRPPGKARDPREKYSGPNRRGRFTITTDWPSGESFIR